MGYLFQLSICKYTYVYISLYGFWIYRLNIHMYICIFISVWLLDIPFKSHEELAVI
jgi:hypothetical protein